MSVWSFLGGVCQWKTMLYVWSWLFSKTSQYLSSFCQLGELFRLGELFSLAPLEVPIGSWMCKVILLVLNHFDQLMLVFQSMNLVRLLQRMIIKACFCKLTVVIFIILQHNDIFIRINQKWKLTCRVVSHGDWEYFLQDHTGFVLQLQAAPHPAHAWLWLPLWYVPSFQTIPLQNSIMFFLVPNFL